MKNAWSTDPDGAILRRRARTEMVRRILAKAFAVAIGILVVALVVGALFGGVYLLVYIARVAWEAGR